MACSNRTARLSWPVRPTALSYASAARSRAGSGIPPPPGSRTDRGCSGGRSPRAGPAGSPSASSLADDEEHRGLVERVHRLHGHVFGVARTDADDQDGFHAAFSHTSAGRAPCCDRRQMTGQSRDEQAFSPPTRQFHPRHPCGGGPGAGVAVQRRSARLVGIGSEIAIALLFFLQGARLSRPAVVAGILHWRLHLIIVVATFVVFPLLGLALRPLSGTVLSPPLYVGMVFLCTLPSAVQASVIFTSIAGGNVPAALCSASFSSVIGMVLTPLLVGLLLQAHGGVAERRRLDRTAFAAAVRRRAGSCGAGSAPGCNATGAE